ncbi:nitrate/nitrite two-component system sensor histidine kinase NarX [Proteus hauseri]|uniref:Sensor protein n=1 Tax=Proteus cibi TaxID=2050966 RepID=A0ABU6EGJ5_9GAMM|nr:MULTISPECIES: nitrate/nitrite two-component system sensor histidine kinase NarX [Proteus]EST56855.1 nitrate/nitrite teo-component system, sensor kinase [Proteus hauseri ZMd44]MBG6031685.1 nitrate/nitrite two-component system sensor histidine kinase NarX [Proteus hauseri]MEB6858204.1 nitrate/nitrite two-component system sensor histidine kinase NarX [Proteus cibi]MEB7089507.1 nitrate/nitrite two-component system sensor histidine kinase NarX [Proteus cibi]
MSTHKIQWHYRFSIINQIAILMLLFTLLGVVGMAISNHIILSVQGNAHAINKSGSLRMQSYRLLSALPLDEQHRYYLHELETDLDSGELRQVLSNESLQSQYAQLNTYWKDTLKPTLLYAKQRDDAKQEVVFFVSQLDKLVLSIDQLTEQKIRLVAYTQLIFTALTLLLLFGSVWHFRRRLLHPWQQLMTMANSIGHGDFSARFHQRTHHDEIATLGIALNTMSEELSTLYSELEKRVVEKTYDLQQKNKVLSYLYHSSQQLHSPAPLCARLRQILFELQQIIPDTYFQIRLYEDNHHTLFNEISLEPQPRSEHCPDPQCERCEDNTPITTSLNSELLHWELADQIHRYGLFVIQLPENTVLTDEQNNLMLLLTKQISAMLAMEQQNEQQQQLLLMDERSAIARELHDSIAQSLSCLKMQVSYLQMQSETLPDNCQKLLKEMREELNVAYRQLRELLTTFRLKLTEPGLLAALESTLTEFNQRLGFSINFDYQLPAKCVNSHQSIHVVQIVREALNNILQHANANWAEVSLSLNNGMVELKINDNGEGINPEPEKLNHYGLIIMRERANSLNGSYTIKVREQGGTQVFVKFPLITTHKDPV